MTVDRSLASLVVGVVALAGTGAIAAEGLTHKPGLWETTVQVAGHTMVTQMCTDAATEASNLATTAAYMKANCTKNELTQQGDKFISDTECTFAGHHVVGHGVTTRIGDNGRCITSRASLARCAVCQIAASTFLLPCRLPPNYAVDRAAIVPHAAVQANSDFVGTRIAGSSCCAMPCGRGPTCRM